jgi:hypothetical protein
VYSLSKVPKMSEYQYHEWQTLERPLTADEQNAVNELSSHIDVTAAQAIVTYHWSDFRHDPLEVLAKYFDAYLYFANWGTRRLAFCFPKGLVDATAIDTSYCDEDYLHIKTIGDVHILEFEMYEDGGYDEWIEERGLLSTLAHLRDDIIQGDHRTLYLFWLHVMDVESRGYEEEDKDNPDGLFYDPEPPLPVGLKQLSPSLRALIDFFEIDPFLVSAAAKRSPSLSPSNQPDFAPWIARLTRQECDEFLLKIVNAEPGAVATLRKKLLSFEQSKPDVRTEPRTFGELLDAGEKIRQAETRRQAEERRRKHIAEMQDLEKQESQTWQDVERLIQSGYTAQNYDSATALLSKLHQLAGFQGTQTNFDIQLGGLAEKFKSRSALMRRWKKMGWL